MDLAISPGILLSALIEKKKKSKLMLPFFLHAADSLLHNISFTSRGPVHHEKRITKKKRENSARDWATLRSLFTRYRCPCLREQSPQGIRLPLYYPALITLPSCPPLPTTPSHSTSHHPHWGITSWEEADGIQSMKRWQDWATRVWPSEDLLFLRCLTQVLHTDFFFFFSQIQL